MDEGEGNVISRYRDKRIEMIWCDEAKYVRWHRVEVENMRRVAGDEYAKALKYVGPPSVPQVRKWEKRVRHDVMAFLLALDAKLVVMQQEDPNAQDVVSKVRAWLHYELTSSDVVDTAMHMALGETQTVLGEYARDLRHALAHFVGRAEEQGNTIGRTHGQWAVPMPVAHPWRVLLVMLRRAESALYYSDLTYGKLGGPVGTQGDQFTSEADALAELGLTPIGSTQIVPRDLMMRFVDRLVRVTDVCEAIATKVWLLAQQDVGELREGKAPVQVGSSAMPHKRNPIVSEHIRGLCRLARGYRTMLEPSIIQWGEHDLAHSCVERVALPDLCHVAARVITQTHVLLNNLEFIEGTTWSQVQKLYPDTHGMLIELQQQGVPYVEAHAQLMGSYQPGKMERTNTEEESA